MKFSGHFDCPFLGLWPKVLPLSGIGFIEICPAGIEVQGYTLQIQARRRFWALSAAGIIAIGALRLLNWTLYHAGTLSSVGHGMAHHRGTFGFLPLTNTWLYLGIGLAFFVNRLLVFKKIAKIPTQPIQFTIPWQRLRGVGPGSIASSCVLLSLDCSQTIRELPTIRAYPEGQLHFYPDGEVATFIELLTEYKNSPT